MLNAIFAVDYTRHVFNVFFSRKEQLLATMAPILMLETVRTDNFPVNCLISVFNRDIADPAVREGVKAIGAYINIPLLDIFPDKRGVTQIAF
jgi:hypothetical protein